jgi:hypothetical protein
MKQNILRETIVEGHENSTQSENEGLRQACMTLWLALDLMCRNYPVFDEVREVRERFRYLNEI